MSTLTFNKMMMTPKRPSFCRILYYV